ncbi:MAG TPA: beta-galactosidase [Terriglobia bacterium]|nr:beta-galactosidase [Terriglobia bacterium]
MDESSPGRAESRRDFLKSLVSAPLVAGAGLSLGSGALLFPSARAALDANALSVDFPQPHFIRYDSHCFTVNDRDRFLFGACFHYPRCPRELWRDRLLKLKIAGFNVIETYIFWNYHEPVEGQVDLSEFEDFVRLVGEMGFYMIARPGPYICAEWDSGGFPRWVIKRQFPLRSNDPESIGTSQHWFSEVLPVIARHQVTHSGPIILMQVENEYDYWKLADDQKSAYIKALAHMAWQGGIDVPLITCWTKQVRERQDPDFARMLDTCNFYPRWNVIRETVPALARLRQRQPDAPMGVTELQGGWFSQFGGKLSVDQQGVSGPQLNMLTKTVIEQGVTFFNYYMGFGGTNFDWAAQNLTTTYDYAAPLREPGGLWDKYYAARGIGCSLRLLGGVIARAESVTGAASSTNSQVSVSLRAYQKSGAVFIRENANAVQQYKASFQDPNSPTHRMINVPREGTLELGAREMKMLPVQIPIGDNVLRYSTAEVLAYGEGSRPHLILYDDPGRLIEFGLATEKEPHIEGDTAYRYWDQEYESVVVGVTVEAREKMLLVENHFQIIILPRERALKSWTIEWPLAALPGGAGLPDEERRDRVAVPFFTDAALAAASGREKKTLWAELDFAPGEHDVLGLVPPLPAKLWLNSVETQFDYDRHWETCRFRVSVPKLPVRSQELRPELMAVEPLNTGAGEWLSTPLRPLDDLGPLPYGYVKYRAEFSYAGPSRMFLAAFANDGRKVFVNGKLVPEASRPAKNVDFDLAAYAHRGANQIEIAYEQFGNPNFGENLGEMKGIGSVRVGRDESSATPIEKWQVQLFPAIMKGRRLDVHFMGDGWEQPQAGARGPALGDGTRAAGGILPAFTWCRAEFSLDADPLGWFLPRKLTIETDRDALLYLNGIFVGRYVIAGPQKDFYLPEPYLAFGSKTGNVVTVALAYTDSLAALHTLTVSPYEEFVTQRTRVEFQW